jgi:hypothetical protein
MLPPAPAGWLNGVTFGLPTEGALRAKIARRIKSMADETDSEAPRDLDYEQSRLAFTIIQSLLEHTRVVSDLIAVMAQALDADTQKALTQTPNWEAYLESRRLLERTRADVEKFAEIMKKLSADE